LPESGSVFENADGKKACCSPQKSFCIMLFIQIPFYISIFSVF